MCKTHDDFLTLPHESKTKYIGEGPSIPEKLFVAVLCSLEMIIRNFAIDLDALISIEMMVSQDGRDPVVRPNYQKQSWTNNIIHHRDAVEIRVYRYLKICRGLILAPYNEIDG